MEKSKRTEHQQKIADALTKVQENLIAFKKRIDSPLVVSRDGKVAYIKPWLEEEDVTHLYKKE